ncbi:secreted subtilisin-like protease [Bacillus sp. ZZV12-4809]|uniref:hypothetical protein n=1 Tax=Cytobacillus sp. AMY 15.2 TaxID=2939563 RepID=UPI0013569BD7|nr:hypothetical protein [Cytobacillus sp. AMY 15.2]KAF0819138.1 secreted subtilisin-like protease [Bacillus sp. ZZV12-4809]MCM3091803.1 hypothetical protein [Cytobacillus sp. AMY 15.2]
MILYLLGFCAVLLGAGMFVDWWHKKHGIDDFNPEENEKHVSESERANMESNMHNMKNDHHNGMS